MRNTLISRRRGVVPVPVDLEVTPLLTSLRVAGPEKQAFGALYPEEAAFELKAATVQVRAGTAGAQVCRLFQAAPPPPAGLGEWLTAAVASGGFAKLTAAELAAREAAGRGFLRRLRERYLWQAGSPKAVAVRTGELTEWVVVYAEPGAVNRPRKKRLSALGTILSAYPSS